MENLTISINGQGASIQCLENQNSYIIRGTGPEGYVNVSIMKDDPEAKQKILDLTDEMYEYQKSKIDEFVETVPNQFAEQYSELTDNLNEKFSE